MENHSLKYWELTDEIPNDMPIMDRWLERAAQDRPLEGVTALLIQHQLGNQVPQARALINLGVAPRDIYWIDIPYTSSSAVRDAVRALGVPEKNFMVSKFQLLSRYAAFQRLRVQECVRNFLANPPERLVVLDDGAYMLEALACIKDRLPHVAIVEQTTRGFIKLDENAALDICSKKFPIVDVARSRPKGTLEPPFIGYAVCDKLRTRLGAELRVGPRDRCLVLGYGAIGQQVARFAHQALGFSRDHVHVYDALADRVKAATANGFAPWSRSDRETLFKLVLGCSGRASFTIGDHVLLEDGAFLASASSGTVELSREAFIELAEESPLDDIEIVGKDLDTNKVHSDLRFRFIDRTATFVNGGFPVNFDGRVNCVPAHYIQPTPTMMCMATVQAARAQNPGVIRLDEPFGNWLDTEFRTELGDEATLLAPVSR